MTTPNAEASLTLVRLLRTASDLFASDGYDATTLEEIARLSSVELVEVTSLFPTTESLMQALLDHDLNEGLASAELEAAGEGPAVVRLYRYLSKDIAWILASPYDLSGIDRVHMINRLEFRPWRDKLERLRALRLEMVGQAIDEGDFINVAPEFAHEAITSVIIGTVRTRHPAPEFDADAHGADLAAFALRSLLADPKRIDEIRQRALDESA